MRLDPAWVGSWVPRTYARSTGRRRRPARPAPGALTTRWIPGYGVAMTTHDARSTSQKSGKTVPQWLSLVIGAAFTLAGIAGFFVTGFQGWTEHDPDQTLLGLAVNPLHNVVHLLIGVAGLVLSRSEASARLYGWLLAVGYGVTLVYGLVVAGSAEGNLLNINAADNVLHGGSVVLGLVIALWPRDRDRATTTSR